MLIQLNIKLHSGKIIPVAFRSGAFRGTFRDEFQNAWIPLEQVTIGMAILAEPPANFHSSGMHQIPLESPESGRNLWGTDKNSVESALGTSELKGRCKALFHSALCTRSKISENICSIQNITHIIIISPNVFRTLRTHAHFFTVLIPIGTSRNSRASN